MPRLRLLSPAIKPLGSGLSMLSDQGVKDRVRDQSNPWRKWYRTADWRRLREATLRRDRLICQRTGVACVGRYPAWNSPVVDHIKPHRGDPALFFDPSNLQTVTKRYHDSEKQKLERRGQR